MITSGGENIFPNDIEDALYWQPAVQLCAVVGAPDEKWGEIVVSVVVLHAEYKHIDEAVPIAHYRANRWSLKVPKRLDFRSQLPLSSFGKIL